MSKTEANHSPVADDAEQVFAVCHGEVLPEITDEAEALIKEARQRQRRRWLVFSAMIVVAATIVLSVVLTSGRTPSKSKSNIPPTKSSLPPVPAAVTPCVSSDLSASIGFVQGTAQHWFIPLTFTNVSHASCSVTGYPMLSFINQAGHIVGMPIMQQGGGSSGPITLKSGESAGAVLWEHNTTDLVRAGQPCSPTPWAAIRIDSPAATVVTPSEGAVPATNTTCATGEAAWVGPLRVPPL
jgi:hypothetical protein